MTPMHRVLAFCALALAAQPVPAGDLLALGTLPQSGTWLGPETHIVLSGTINGRGVQLGRPDTFGEGYAWGVTATRRYEYQLGQSGKPWVGATWLYQGIEVQMEAAAGGHATVTIWLSAMDWSASPAPAAWDLAAVPPALGSAEARLRVRIEWQTDDTLSIEEASDWTGSLTLVRDEGAQEEGTGILSDGRVGGTVDAARGEDRLWISFMAPVDEVRGPRR